jgi:hypothetical protein
MWYHKNYFQYGIKEVQNYVTSPEYISRVLSESDAGFLFDIGHNLCSGVTKILENEFSGAIQDYFSQIIEATGGKTYQIHLNVPGGSEKTGYVDKHMPFVKGDVAGEQTIDLAKRVISASPRLKTITLEINSNRVSPKEHAKLLVQQAELVTKELF